MNTATLHKQLQGLAAILENPEVEATIMMVVEQFATALAQIGETREGDTHPLPSRGGTYHWQIRMGAVVVHWRTTNEAPPKRGIFSFAVDLLWDDAKRAQHIDGLIRNAKQAQAARQAAQADAEDRAAYQQFLALAARFAGRPVEFSETAPA